MKNLIKDNAPLIAVGFGIAYGAILGITAIVQNFNVAGFHLPY